MLNWIVWNGTIFDIESVLILIWIVWYRIVFTFKFAQSAGAVEYADFFSAEG